MLTGIVTDENLAWEMDSFKPEDSVFNLSEKAIAELGGNTEYPALASEIESFRVDSLEKGRGFGIVRGLEGLDEAQQRDAYGIIINLLGEQLKQNIAGEKFVEVRDRGKTMQEGGRYHQTKQGGSLHTDSPQWINAPDYLGMLCIRPAKEGGESKLISAYSVHNQIFAQDSNFLEPLYGSFHFDKRGEFEEGESPTTYASVFKYDDEGLHFRYLRDYMDQGHERVGEPLTEGQIKALDSVDRALADEKLVYQFEMKAGEIQFVNNQRVVHGRTGFEDHEEEGMKRVMLRSWIRKH